MQDEFNLNNSIQRVWTKLGEWLDSLILSLPNFILALLVLFLFVLAAKYTGVLLNRVLRHKVRQDSIRDITIKIVKITIIAIGFSVALGLLNLDKALASILAGAGVLGLAIGLALQGTLNNTFSGIILSFLPEIQIGDWIENNGYAGRVVEINLRSIIIREADNNHVIIPNSKVIDAPFKNFSRTSRSRVTVDCRVSYTCNLEEAKTLTVHTISEIFPQQGNEEVEFMYLKFGNSAIDFMVRFWTPITNQKEIYFAKSKAIMAIKSTFDQHGIHIPFPIHTLNFPDKLEITQSKLESESDKENKS